MVQLGVGVQQPSQYALSLGVSPVLPDDKRNKFVLDRGVVKRNLDPQPCDAEPSLQMKGLSSLVPLPPSTTSLSPSNDKHKLYCRCPRCRCHRYLALVHRARPPSVKMRRHHASAIGSAFLAHAVPCWALWRLSAPACCEVAACEYSPS